MGTDWERSLLLPGEERLREARVGEQEGRGRAREGDTEPERLMDWTELPGPHGFSDIRFHFLDFVGAVCSSTDVVNVLNTCIRHVKGTTGNNMHMYVCMYVSLYVSIAIIYYELPVSLSMPGFLSDAVIKTFWPKTTWVRKRFILFYNSQVTFPRLLREVRVGTQGRNLGPGSDTETMEGGCAAY